MHYITAEQVYESWAQKTFDKEKEKGKPRPIAQLVCPPNVPSISRPQLAVPVVIIPLDVATGQSSRADSASGHEGIIKSLICSSSVRSGATIVFLGEVCQF